MRWSVGGNAASATLHQLGPGVVYIQSSGGELVFIPELADALEAEITAHGRVVLFVNLLEATRLSGEARDRWSVWTKKHKQHSSAHCLVRSKLVDMALSLVAMFSASDLRSYSDIERFMAAMQQVAPNARLPKLRKVA
jgi:hypothetical protein